MGVAGRSAEREQPGAIRRNDQEEFELDELAVSFLAPEDDEDDESLFDDDEDEDEESDDFDSEVDDSLSAPFEPDFEPDFEERLSVL